MTAEPYLDSSGTAAARPLVDLRGPELGRPELGRPELGRWSAGTLLALLWCAALLIAWRRLAGTISVPLRPGLLLSVGGLVVIVAVGVRLVRRYDPAEPKSWLPDWLLPLLTTTAVVSLGAAVSLRGSATWGLLAFWAMLLGEELWAWRPAIWRRTPGGREARRSCRPREMAAHEKRPAQPRPAPVSDGGPGDDVLQQLTRSQAADGTDQLSGWLRTEFAAGQRTASVHLAFCPQFDKTPELSVDQVDGPELQRINKAVHSFGARLDLKLAEPAEKPLGMLLQVSARSKPLVPATTGRKNTP